MIGSRTEMRHKGPNCQCGAIRPITFWGRSWEAAALRGLRLPRSTFRILVEFYSSQAVHDRGAHCDAAQGPSSSVRDRTASNILGVVPGDRYARWITIPLDNVLFGRFHAEDVTSCKHVTDEW